MIKNNDIQSTFENIKSYFETYVKTYRPYKDNPVFKSILETLIDTYYKHLYLDVPSDLLDLVVKNVINPRTNIDYVLVEIGLPEELIQKMTISEKWIFFQIFADFTRYKSTIQFFQMLGEVSETSFPEKFSIYELWIDRDNDTGNWILRPLPIYETETTSDVVLNDIPYNEVYEKLPSLLVSEQQLQTWFDNNQLILPLKSNLILLRQYEITDVSEVSGLIRASFLNNFRSYLINLYFADGSYVANLRFVDKLWYYLLIRCYNSEQLEKDFTNVILFSPENASVPDISQIQSILQQYQNINSWSEYTSFYQEYIEPFVIPHYHQSAVTSASLYDDLYAEESELMSYIDNRINSVDDPKAEIVTIMDEIYGSLLLSTIDYANDQYYQEYLPVYLNSLSKIFLDIDSNSLNRSRAFTTKVILTLKPFHTDILLEAFKAVRARDKEYFEDLYNFVMKVNSASLISINADAFLLFKLIHNLIFPITIMNIFRFIKNLSEEEEINERVIIEFFKSIASVITASDDIIPIQKKFTSSNIPLISVLRTIYDQISQDQLDISDFDTFLKLFIKSVSLLSIGDSKYVFQDKVSSDSLPLISICRNLFNSTRFDQLNITILKVISNLLVYYSSILSSSDSDYAMQRKDSSDSVTLVSVGNTKFTNESSPEIYTIDDSQYTINIV